MQPNQPPQKLLDFNKELEELCKKYQYQLRAILQTVSDPAMPGVMLGLQASMQAFDVSPKDEGVKLNPESSVADATPQEQAKKNENPSESNQDTLAESQSAVSGETPIDNGLPN